MSHLVIQLPPQNPRRRQPPPLLSRHLLPLHAGPQSPEQAHLGPKPPHARSRDKLTLARGIQPRPCADLDRATSPPSIACRSAPLLEADPASFASLRPPPGPSGDRRCHDASARGLPAAVAPTSASGTAPRHRPLLPSDLAPPPPDPPRPASSLLPRRRCRLPPPGPCLDRGIETKGRRRPKASRAWVSTPSSAHRAARAPSSRPPCLLPPPLHSFGPRPMCTSSR
ncbi:proline-rich receptor-like protein kinase PERK9 [Triticum dicoccoides]|uniref:proline-rich receptor-like protein kinase PERK9 n=1 Tax=Triticum dicoccoides TaxID=85692 RepID=UPI00188F2A49|nr:proline-rich receptor-like protein kinase PERK9 [Triticum dicoccoides]